MAKCEFKVSQAGKQDSQANAKFAEKGDLNDRGNILLLDFITSCK